LKKEDGSNIKVDDQCDFVVLEFSKENRKIIVSHTKVWQEAKKDDASEKSSKKTDKKKTKSPKVVQEKMEKATLGDIEALANLKSDIESEEKKKSEKAKKQDETSKED